MSGNPMYGWPSGNSIGQWHQQAPPPPANTMHYGGSVPSVNNAMIGMPNSDTLQPSMQSVQQIHSMPSRRPHQSLQQQQQMPRTSGLYQPMATTSPSQSQLAQQNSQFQQHPQQSHYSQYTPSVLTSQYWASPMTQQEPLGTLPSSQTPSGFQQHHSLHQQSPTASPLPHQSVRGHPPTSHTPDRSNRPPSISANSSIQQTPSPFPNSKDLLGTDQHMISSLSRHGLQQQHPSGSIQMMQQSSSASSINNLPVSPTHGPTASQMRSMQQPQQPASSWQQTNQYYQQQNQTRFPSASSVNPYMAYGGSSGTDMPNNLAVSTAQSASPRHMIGQKPGIDNNDRTVRGSSSGWSPISGNLYPQQHSSAQGGSNNNYYGHSYDSSSYYSMSGQSNMDSSQTHNNSNSNIHQNQYWNTSLNHGQSPSTPVNRPVINSMQHHNLIQQSPSASPLPHSVRNQPPSSHTPDRSPSIGNIPPSAVPATSFPSPGQQSSTATKNASGSSSLAQLEQMVMPHLSGAAGVVKSPSHRSSTSSPILNSAASTGGSMNQQLPYSTNYNTNATDQNSASYFNSANSGSGQQQHGYFPQYGTSSTEIFKNSTMWPEQPGPQAAPAPTAPGPSMMDTSQYGQPNQYETQPNASYGDYTSSSLPTSSHEYSHMPQSETSSAPAPEAADPYAIDFQTFDDYDEQPSTLKSKKGRPKKGDGSETKKERKPRAPRTFKTPSAPKGKKAKSSNIPLADQSIEPAIQSAQFESNDVLNSGYNQMINQEHYPASQDPYNTGIINQPESQNIYDSTDISHLQPITKVDESQQLSAQQEYLPYEQNYIQQSDVNQVPVNDEMFTQSRSLMTDSSTEVPEVFREPSYDDRNGIVIPVQENGGSEAGTDALDRAGNHDKNSSVDPTLDKSNGVEPTLNPTITQDDYLSKDSQTSCPPQTCNQNLDEPLTENNLKVDEELLAHSNEHNNADHAHLTIDSSIQTTTQDDSITSKPTPEDSDNHRELYTEKSRDPSPKSKKLKMSNCSLDDKQSDSKSFTDCLPSSENVINQKAQNLEPSSSEVPIEDTLKNEDVSQNNSVKQTVAQQITKREEKGSTKEIVEITHINRPTQIDKGTNIDSNKNNNDSRQEMKNEDSKAFGKKRPTKLNSRTNSSDDAKPKRVRLDWHHNKSTSCDGSPTDRTKIATCTTKKNSREQHSSLKEETASNSERKTSDFRNSPDATQKSVPLSNEHKVSPGYNDSSVIANKIKDTNTKNEPVIVSVATTSQPNKHDQVVSPALSSSSTSTVSLVKQDLSPSASSTDKPVICLVAGSNSFGTSSISPATKATSNGSGSSGGSGHKSSRRRSSERRESVREGLMRTTDFVIAKKDLKNEHPHLWRITGNNLLQQFEPTKHDGLVLYENTNQYAGWNPDIKKDYVGVDVRLTQHSRSQIMVERLYLNLQTLNEATQFYNHHYEVYVQILISVCLDAQFWQGFENEPEKLDYFMASARVMDDVIQREKTKFMSKVKLKLDPDIIKCLDRYPNIITEQLQKSEKDHQCMACNNGPCNYITTFTMESYDRDSLQVIKSTLDKVETKKIRLCNTCNERVRLYSEMQHFKWKLYLKAKERVRTHPKQIQSHLNNEKQISEILYECLNDDEWMLMMCEERDKLWDKVERVV